MKEECIFCKIAHGEMDADEVFRNEEIVAFRDIAPQAPVHVLIIPKRHIATVNDITPDDRDLIGNMFLVAKEIARREGLHERGYRLLFNCNREGGQAVYHIHLHLLGGRQMLWPPG